MTNFGASLKKARETQGLTIAQIADETRISSRFLKAIENEQFNLLPGGIFNRGFIRTFAIRVGLDPDATLREYEQLINVQPPEQPSVQTPAPVVKSGKNLYGVAVGALVLAIAVFYVVTRDSGKPAIAGHADLPAEQAASSPPVNRQVIAAPQVSDQVISTPLTPSTSAAPAAEPSSSSAQASAITLDVEATDQTWIKVKADGANVLPGEILEPGMTRHFNAESSLNITVGNAGGLNLKLNDQTMKAIGKTGQVRELLVTPENINTFLE